MTPIGAADATSGRGTLRRAAAAGLGLIAAVAVLSAAPAGAQAPGGDPARGEAVFDAAGCFGCHTDPVGPGAPLSGGRALKTPFGTFRSPNITPDPETGIGRWTEAQFADAVRQGRMPTGESYFPAFPFVAYARMTDADVRDLFAYLKAQPPVRKANRPHDLSPPFGWRFLLPVWRTLHFDDDPLLPAPGRSESWVRGRYLVEVLGHCAECHTPRTWLGGLDRSRAYQGVAGAGVHGGGAVPGITQNPRTGIGDWSDDDILFLLEYGMTASGGTLGGGMGEVVRHGTSKMSDADRRAIVVYLRSLPAGP
jgi:mono/diheme cytochrome c family protein